MTSKIKQYCNRNLGCVVVVSESLSYSHSRGFLSFCVILFLPEMLRRIYIKGEIKIFKSYFVVMFLFPFTSSLMMSYTTFLNKLLNLYPRYRRHD